MALPSPISLFTPFSFGGVAVCPSPYPHFEAANFLQAEIADSLLDWLAKKAPWQPRKLQGYIGYSDIALQPGDLPARFDSLLEPESLSCLRISMGRWFGMAPEGYVKITAHRMLPGGSLKPHCDLAPVKFTHRLLIHLNRGWTRENGGLLCLLDVDPSANRLVSQKQLLPSHRSAFAFEISHKSFHAVTPIVAGERYTLSYTFYPPG
jgi:2OG-Fe(II) oxygenase superfamily